MALRGRGPPWPLPEALGEAQPHSGVQRQVQQLLGHVLHAVADVVELRAGGVGVDALVVHLSQPGGAGEVVYDVGLTWELV